MVEVHAGERRFVCHRLHAAACSQGEWDRLFGDDSICVGGVVAHTPVVHDLFQSAVVHQFLERLLHGLSGLHIILLDGRAHLHGVPHRFELFQLASGLLDGVVVSVGFGVESIRLARDDRCGHIGLLLEGFDVHGFLAVGFALLGGLVDLLRVLLVWTVMWRPHRLSGSIVDMSVGLPFFTTNAMPTC